MTLTGCSYRHRPDLSRCAQFSASSWQRISRSFWCPHDTIYMDIAAALLIAFLAAIIPTRHAIRIRIADGLRRIG
ncbi:MAG: hypothetical protein MZV70_03970 [Desulfobacterales bacterium]|nr:hypothetical protein [Desulfobacterales bacterium]